MRPSRSRNAICDLTVYPTTPDLREKYLRTAPARVALRRARAGVAGASSVERAMERVLRIAAAGLVHLSTRTRCESSRSLPCRLSHGHVAAAKLFGIEEVPSIRTSHFSEAYTSGILGHLRAVHSAYAVGNPMGEVKANID